MKYYLKATALVLIPLAMMFVLVDALFNPNDITAQVLAGIVGVVVLGFIIHTAARTLKEGSKK